MNKRKRFIALLLCVLLTICALPLTALAAYAPVGTEDEPSSVRLYEYYSSAGGMGGAENASSLEYTDR